MTPLSRSDGPPYAWPARLDAALDLWASASGRVRLLVRVVAFVLTLLAASGGLARGPWGRPVEVVIALVDVAAGAPVPHGALSVAMRPASLVPPDALLGLAAAPSGSISAGAIVAGTVVTHRHLLTDGPASAATVGTAVVPIPADLMPALAVGTRLDVAVGDDLGGTYAVVSDAVMVGDDGTVRWIRVDRASVPVLTAGISRAALVIAVLPPPRSAVP